MSLLKVNEVQNYNGSSLTLTASTVSTSAQLNTGGNISVTGSINVSDDSTTRSNLGLGSIATQNANAVALTGGSLTGTEIDLKSSGTTVYASNGSTSLISESSGTVTLNNVTLGSNVSGIGQLIGISYISAASTAGNQVTLESSKSYHVIQWSYQSAVPATYVEYTELSTDSSGNVTITSRINVDSSSVLLESTSTNLVRIKAPASSSFIRNAAFIFEQGSNFDAS